MEALQLCSVPTMASGKQPEGMTVNILPSWINHPPSRILLDAEPLLAFVVGSFDRSRLGTESSEKFEPADFDILENLARHFQLVCTPNILTEVNDWLGHFGYIRAELRAMFASKIPEMLEYYTPSLELSSGLKFIDVGLSDSSILFTARKLNALVITTDGRLIPHLYSANIAALLFSQLKNYYAART